MRSRRSSRRSRPELPDGSRDLSRQDESRLDRARRWAWSLKRDVLALYLAARDPRVPRHAKLVAACVAAYALSPIDLVPDFVPVLGYLDDLVIVPLGILLAVRLIPAELLEEHRHAAAEYGAARPTSRSAAALIIGLWLACAALLAFWLFRWVTPPQS